MHSSIFSRVPHDLFKDSTTSHYAHFFFLLEDHHPGIPSPGFTYFPINDLDYFINSEPDIFRTIPGETHEIQSVHGVVVWKAKNGPLKSTSPKIWSKWNLMVRFSSPLTVYAGYIQSGKKGTKLYLVTDLKPLHVDLI